MTLSWSYGGDSVGSIGLQAKFDGVRLFYRRRRDDGEWYDVDELVPTVWTPTQFGGRRQWFCCLKCARRCRILYGGSRFGVGAAIASATAHKPRRVPIAPPAPCSRSFDASTRRGRAMTCPRSQGHALADL